MCRVCVCDLDCEELFRTRHTSNVRAGPNFAICFRVLQIVFEAVSIRSEKIYFDFLKVRIALFVRFC